MARVEYEAFLSWDGDAKRFAIGKINARNLEEAERLAKPFARFELLNSFAKDDFARPVMLGLQLGRANWLVARWSETDAKWTSIPKE